MKKQLSLILALLLLASSFASCANTSGGNSGGSDTSDTTGGESNPDETEIETDTEETRIKLGLEEGLDFDGYNMRVLTKTAEVGDSFITDLNGDAVNDALYNRDRTVEKLLDIKITPTSYTDMGYDAAKLQNLIQSNEDAYDFLHIQASTFFANRPTYELLMLDMANEDNLDLEAPWWNTPAMDELSYNGKVRKYLIGDISKSSISGASVIFYNKNLFGDIYQNPDQPYTDVIEGKWTVDKIAEYCEGAYQDTDGNGTKDETDFWGTMMNPWLLASAFNGFSDTRFYTRDSDGYIRLDLDEDRVVTYSEKLWSFVRENSGVYYTTDNNWHNNATKLFAEGNMLFLGFFLSSVENEEFRTMDDDYGILPFFKLDESQEKYYSDLNPSGTQWICVPKTCREVDKTTATIEALSYYSYYDVTPIFYESALKSKYTRDQQSGIVIDMVRDSIRTDYLIAIYRSTIGQHFVNQIAANNQGYISSWQKSLKNYTKQMEKAYAQLDDEIK